MSQIPPLSVFDTLAKLLQSRRELSGKQGPYTASPEVLAQLDCRLEDLQHKLEAMCQSLEVTFDDHATALDSPGDASTLSPKRLETPEQPGKE